MPSAYRYYPTHGAQVNFEFKLLLNLLEVHVVLNQQAVNHFGSLLSAENASKLVHRRELYFMGSSRRLV